MELEDLQKQEYEVIADKTLSNQDHLFKLIIIGDTGKAFWPFLPIFGRNYFNWR